MRKTIVLTLLCLISTFIYGQDNTGLKGRILDETKQPLPGATIVITTIKKGTSSDFNGYYELLNIPTGKHTVKISFIGYTTLEQEITFGNNLQILNFNLVPQTNKLDEVIIAGSITRGQAKALNQQKNKQNITNIISADQVGKFPDANIGDALKRVPGIAMQNDQGEARDIIIRGLAPQLNSVTLNGDRIPSAEGDNRRVQMDLIPSDMIQTIEVNKAVTPDMEGDAIGGSVNLITRSAPNVFRASLTGSFGISPIRELANYNLSAIVADRLFDKKLGYVVSTSFNSNDYGSDNVEFVWAEGVNGNYIEEHDIRRYDVKRDGMSASLNLDFVVDKNSTFYFKSMYNQRKDWENRYRLSFVDVEEPDVDGFSAAEVRRQTKGGTASNDNRRLEDQQTYKLSVGGDHILFNTIKLNWKTGISSASEIRPNERYVRYENTDVSVFQDFSKNKFPTLTPTNTDYNNPLLFEFDEATEEKKHTRERKINSKLDILIPLNTSGDYQSSIKTGYKFNNKEKLRKNNFYEYDLGIDYMSETEVKDYTLTDFLPGSNYALGTFTSSEYLGGLNLEDGEAVWDEFVPENYNADEDIHAAYAMLNQNIGDKFSLIAGVRLESTSINYLGYSIKEVEINGQDTFEIEENKGKKSYTNWLPNIHLKYNFTNNTIVKAAWTNTIARPNYFDLVPYEVYDEEDLERGNPALDPTTSMNFDVMAEHYFSNVGILSGGVFYKNLDDFIYTYATEEDINGERFDVTQPQNGGTATIFGFEVALQRKLNFLPGFLKNLTLYANYTFTESETDGIVDREDGLALAGAVPNMLNTSLAFENKKLSIRASLNYAADYISEYSDDTFEDEYYDEQLFVDVNASYNITKNLRVFGEAKNLTNQELRFYQGTKNQTMQAEFYNFNWNLGLKYNF